MCQNCSVLDTFRNEMKASVESLKNNFAKANSRIISLENTDFLIASFDGVANDGSFTVVVKPHRQH